MAFPSVTSITETSETGDPANLTANLPATVDADDLLVAIFTHEENASLTAPASPWVEIVNLTVNGALLVAVKKADGTEDGGTVVASASRTGNGAHQVYRITAASWSGDTADIEGTISDSGVTNTPDPPSETASWGAEDNLWLSIATGRDDDASNTSYSTNYTNGTHTVSGGGASNGVSLSTCRRELNTATEDPGVITISATPTQQSIAATVVIRPSAASAQVTMLPEMFTLMGFR